MTKDKILFNNIGNGSGSHRSPAFTDRKPQAFLHRDRRDQLDLPAGVDVEIKAFGRQ